MRSVLRVHGGVHEARCCTYCETAGHALTKRALESCPHAALAFHHIRALPQEFADLALCGSCGQAAQRFTQRLLACVACSGNHVKLVVGASDVVAHIVSELSMCEALQHHAQSASSVHCHAIALEIASIVVHPTHRGPFRCGVPHRQGGECRLGGHAHRLGGRDPYLAR